ncbi:MAG: hypothetical protein IGS38_00565 [Synechococcales cyanobacterium M58_A2018_015]|nr:hypothetical protein [Synechococcales cyanobacterium M58_A2018_015]
MSDCTTETPQSSSARFRSATEFPKTIASLERAEAEQLYREMRDCLIFTNRSRAQLLRRNEEHKQSALQLKADVAKMQQLIQELGLEKQQIIASNQQVVAELTHQMQTMARHLDQLAEAFDGIADCNPDQSPMNWLAQPGRFMRFIKAIKAIVLFWRDDDLNPGATLPPAPLSPLPPTPADVEADRKEHPQMYQDPASINRSLLDR